MQARFDTCLDGLLPDGGAVLLAVSGGIDSMVMADLASKSVHKFAVAHCNFHLRGTESDGDETFVSEWAAKKGIPTPIASALITIASALKSTDYRKVGYDISDVEDYI